jgi:PAS domain S-box-containing protein
MILKGICSLKQWSAWAILGMGVLLSVFASLQVRQEIENDAVRQFASICDQTTLIIQKRLGAYALILRGGSALFAASGTVERHQWRAYVETLHLRKSIPGVQGIGFAQLIPSRQLAEHVARIRGEGFPEYTVRPPGERAVYTSIIYLEPFSARNLRAFGYDMLSEPVRRVAMEQARDTGEAVLSGRVELVQETGVDVQSGTLMYVPVYRHGAAADTLEQRREALIGWVYSPYRMTDLMTGILAGQTRHESNPFALQIYAGREASSAGLLFDSLPDTTPVLNSLFHQQRTIDFNGNQWLLVFDADKVTSDINYAEAWSALIGGMALSALLCGLLLSLINTGIHAERLAEKLTATIKNREKLLQESEFRWRFAIEGSGDGLWDWNVTNSTVFFSKRWKEMLGFAEDEIGTGLDEWEKRIHPEDKAGTLDTVQAYLDGQTSFYACEHRVRCKDGGYKWILARGMVVERGEDGKPMRIIGMHTDISEHKRNELVLRDSENLLRASQQQLQLLLDSTAEAIYGIDMDGKCTFCNRSCLRLLGYAHADELIGKNMHAQIHSMFADGTPLPAEDCRVPSAFLKAEDSHADDEVLWRADGTSFPAEYWAYPQIDGDKVVGAVVSFIDITERKRAEAELRRYREHLEDLVNERTLSLAIAKEAAESANRAKSIFLSTMSHELRTPMNGIMGMTSLALRRATDPQQIDFLTRSTGVSKHLLALINNILDISQIEAQRLTLDEKNFSLAQVIDDTLSMQEEPAQLKGLRLSRELAPGLPDLLYGDALRLKQILLNFVGNAIKFSERGQITLSAQVVEEDSNSLLLRIEVTDQGIGLAPEQQSRLFHAFTQVDGSSTRKFGGAGLGLAISRRLAQAMGGDVGVVSQEGIGSTFWITARLKRGSETQPSDTLWPVEPPREALARKFAGLRVLVAEDDPMNQDVARLLLEDAGLAPVVVNNGQEAVERAGEGAYALILMDMKMPVMGGLDAARAIRRLPGLAAIPILAMTANAFDEDRDRCLEAGMNDHVGKPVDPATLYETLLKWLSVPK